MNHLKGTSLATMSTEQLFTAGSEGLIPQADTARQAVDSLRGYAYQITAAALAWLDISERARIFLEVAEDYATMAGGVLNAVQVKDTRASTSVTLNTESVRDAIANFVDLTFANPKVDVRLEYFTTSEIGKEKSTSNPLPQNEPGLIYWRAAAKAGDVSPLRQLLESEKFSDSVRSFVSDRDDEQLRNDLLRKIHWNCGNPDLISLRKEFNERLVVVAREKFQLPATESGKVADVLLYRVLEKSIGKTATERMLTLADLIVAIEECTRVSVSRVMFDRLAALASGLGTQAAGSIPVTSELRWLIDGSLLPKAQRFLSRSVVEVEIEEALGKTAACFISGTSGVGKTHVARSVAEKIGGRFFLVDFRNADYDEAKNRLDVLLSRLGGLQAHTILLEDLNCFDDPQVGMLLAQVFEALSRRDIAVVITCYNSPTPRVLVNMGLAPGCTHACGYFSPEEVKRLVSLHGGDPEVWGQFAYVTGAFGHPQLVHAFIAGMAARKWPKSEILQILDAGMASGDIVAERNSARRMVVNALPESARSLLYRLSLLIGHFSRATALSVADIPSPLSLPGENLDALIGPWVETVGQDRYRISPLAAHFGKEMIPPIERTRIHGSIATHLMLASDIDVSDVDRIITHALVGENSGVLAMVAAKLLTADESVINYLGENFSIFHALATDRPTYPQDAQVSAMLRLMQFKVLMSAKDRGKIPSCLEALWKEVRLLPEESARDAIHVASLVTVLNSIGAANYLKDWFVLLQEYRILMQNESVTEGLQLETVEHAFGADGGASELFAIGSAGLDSVAALERIFDHLNELEPSDRTFYLKAIEESSPDYSVLVNGPWVAEQRCELDHQDAAARYYRMAMYTAGWGIRPITLQCWIARAVLLDEHANDSKGALRVLEEAVESCGDDVLLARACAKIHWRTGNHVLALSILRGIADVVGQDNCVERAFALREAAISAAKTGEWAQAEEWFLESRKSAFEACLSDMKVMAIGLGADAAAAAFQAGDIEQSLRMMGDALAELEGIDPNSSLRSIYCHHVVRHTVLWLASRIENIPVEVNGEPIGMVPGSCSNPEPPASISDRPIASLDVTWYILAKLDVVARTGIGYAQKLQRRIAPNLILPLELDLRATQLMISVEDRDYSRFADCTWNYIECGVAALGPNSKSLGELDVLNPHRARIPTFTPSPLSELAKSLIEAAVLAFAISCACKHRWETMSLMRTAMVSRFGSAAVDSTILSRIDSVTPLSSPSSLGEQLMQDLSVFCADVHPRPIDYVIGGIRSLQTTARHQMKSALIPIVAVWQRSAWRRIVSSEILQLSRPLQTIPAVRAALSNSKNDERFLYGLMLAATDATALQLPPEIRSDFISKLKKEGD